MAQRLAVFGLSITSSWGNGHATTYRGLLGALAQRGWEITFFERDVEWYRANRDLPNPSYCDLRLYADFPSVRAEAETAVRDADLVLVGSYAGDAQALIDWLATRDRPLLFYDIDTPITLTALRCDGEAEYLRADQVPLFQTYFSFTGGTALLELQDEWGARRVEALYCGVDASLYRPAATDPRFECLLGYMGTYAADRQPKVQALLVEPARALASARFLIAGAQYPPMDLPPNVTLLPHVVPADHPAFYSSNWVTLNVTREAMIRYGWSPSVRLFEAASCGACIVSDNWKGLDEVLAPDTEVLLAESTADVLRHLESLTAERRAAIGGAARRRVLAEHTFERRAAQFEAACRAVLDSTPSGPAPGEDSRLLAGAPLAHRDGPPRSGLAAGGLHGHT